MNIETTRATVNNVLAYLPGKTDEYVILGAHYDHLGYGHYDSLAPSQIGQIHPGADDNASGTAGVAGTCADVRAAERANFRAEFCSMSFAGEELGLLGSAEWVKEPTRPSDKAMAMLNMDMIGRIQRRKGVHRRRGHRIDIRERPRQRGERASRSTCENSAGGYSSSDHTSFVAQENSRAVLFLRAACGLSPAFRHLGQNQLRPTPASWWTWSRKDGAGDRRRSKQRPDSSP